MGDDGGRYPGYGVAPLAQRSYEPCGRIQALADEVFGGRVGVGIGQHRTVRVVDDQSRRRRIARDYYVVVAHLLDDHIGDDVPDFPASGVTLPRAGRKRAYQVRGLLNLAHISGQLGCDSGYPAFGKVIQELPDDPYRQCTQVIRG